MKTRRVFKEKFTNKIMQDATGEEIEFPDVEVNDHPGVGDNVLLDGKKETGERLMPNGSLIKFKDGVVTHIIPMPENIENIKKIAAIKDGVCKTLNGWKDNQRQKLEILGANAHSPFRKGNRVLVNGEAIKIAKCEIDGKKITILNGRISEVQAMSNSGNRKVFKSTGKKMAGKPVNSVKKKVIDIPVKSEESKQHKPIAIRIEKIKFMKRLK